MSTRGERLIDKLVTLGQRLEQGSSSNGVDTIVDAIKYIRDHEDATPATDAAPPLEECVAAMNRAKHRGRNDWSITVVSGDASGEYDVDILSLIGEGIIARERRAKGGS